MAVRKSKAQGVDKKDTPVAKSASFSHEQEIARCGNALADAVLSARKAGFVVDVSVPLEKIRHIPVSATSKT